MMRLIFAAVLSVSLLLPMDLVFAQKSLPRVPITYQGDTEASIERRLQWVEGAKKEGVVVWWGSDNQNLIKILATEFNKIYPFINVNFWRGASEERLRKLEAEHSVGRLTVDICDSGDLASFPRWRKMGLVEKYLDVIPGMEKRDKRMNSRYGDWVQLGNNAIVPEYNTKLVSSAEAPKNWEDMLNPKWKGAIGMARETRPWYVLAVVEGGWGVEKTENFLRGLKQQEIIWTQGQSAGHKLLIAGEFKIFAFDNLRHNFDSQKIGAPVEWVRVSPIPVTGDTFILAKKAPHPNAARLFIEWLFSPQGMTIYERLTGLGVASPGSGTRIAKAVEGLTLVYRTEELMLKVGERNLIERFSQILGITPE